LFKHSVVNCMEDLGWNPIQKPCELVYYICSSQISTQALTSLVQLGGRGRGNHNSLFLHPCIWFLCFFVHRRVPETELYRPDLGY
jgi:hypothetical protein